jgi:ATP-dependent RNA circularization protein (DNA/RNA ligase family)
MNDEQQLEQAVYVRRMVDQCSILQLFALTIDTDPESRELSRDERIALANEYAEEWAKSRGYTIG